MSKDASLEIEFYDDPEDINAKGLVWVSFVSKEYSTLSGVYAAEFFKMFLEKILFSLGVRSPSGNMLMTRIGEISSLPITKATNVLSGRNYSLAITEKQKSPRKTIKATFRTRVENTGKINRWVQTKFSRGGEDYYAPMSVFAFLQYIINILSPEELAQFNNAFPEDYGVQAGQTSTVGTDEIGDDEVFGRFFTKETELLNRWEAVNGEVKLSTGILLQAWTLANLLSIKEVFLEDLAEINEETSIKLYQYVSCFNLAEYFRDSSMEEGMPSRFHLSRKEFEEMMFWFFELEEADLQLYKNRLKDNEAISEFMRMNKPVSEDNQEFLSLIRSVRTNIYREVSIKVDGEEDTEFSEANVVSLYKDLQRCSELTFDRLMKYYEICAKKGDILVRRVG